MHLIHAGPHQVLMECGLYQGPRKVAFEINRQLPFDPRSIDAVILSHAHIDHSGNLPSLVRGGFRGPIFATTPTRDLAVHMLLDSAQIQESDIRYVNRRRMAEGKRPFEPLYTADDAVQTVSQFRCVEYGESFRVTPHVQCQMHLAGHMLGAAVVAVDIAEPGQRDVRLVFSGDLGRPHSVMLPPPAVVEGADFLLLESTYGDREHPPEADTDHVLHEAALHAVRTSSRLIIPAFSIGRTQEIVYRLNRLVEQRQLPPLPVFVDSPLAVDATTVYRTHIECFNREVVQSLTDESDGDPMGFRNLYYVRRATHSKQLNSFKGACIIIAASGMCESGRVVHHLKHHAGDPNTTILFAGFQAPHTLGRRILDGAQTVNILGRPVRIRARVARLEGASGHADHSELVDWASAVAAAGRLKQVALVHGELPAAEGLAAALAERRLAPVLIPERGQVHAL